MKNSSLIARSSPDESYGPRTTSRERTYITVVPAIRTVPGVEKFDYAVAPDADIRVGDALRVPFRNRPIPALVIAVSGESAYAERAIELDAPEIFLRLGPAAASLVEETASQCFSSLPSVLHAWFRAVPKRIQSFTAVPGSVMPAKAGIQSEDKLRSGVRNPRLDSRLRGNDTQLSLTHVDHRLLADRWNGKNGLISAAKAARGRTLILTPWKHRADRLAERLNGIALHADLAAGASWSGIRSFVTEPDAVMVSTRIGAWLSSVADVVLIDEPENDDHKQDEMAPRYDARWIVECAARRRPELRVATFGTTPRLGDPLNAIPEIEADISVEPWRKRSGSAVELLSPKTVQEIEAAVAENRETLVLHPVRGVRSRVSCRDCGWKAVCPSCGWGLSLGERLMFCKRCGRRADIPETCPSCGGTDFSRGMPGAERLAEQCRAHFTSDLVRVIDLMEFDRCSTHGRGSETKPLIVMTDLSLLGGASEDIRRRERIIVTWRRVAADAARIGTRLLVQGPEELVSECRSWLSADGVRSAWKKELAERKTFGFPPAVPRAKILFDGDASGAEKLVADLRTAFPKEDAVTGPYPVPFRSATRKRRFIIHVTSPVGLEPDALRPFLTRGFIDLDPVAFFS